MAGAPRPPPPDAAHRRAAHRLFRGAQEQRLCALPLICFMQAPFPPTLPPLLLLPTGAEQRTAFFRGALARSRASLMSRAMKFISFLTRPPLHCLPSADPPFSPSDHRAAGGPRPRRRLRLPPPPRPDGRPLAGGARQARRVGGVQAGHARGAEGPVRRAAGMYLKCSFDYLAFTSLPLSFRGGTSHAGGAEGPVRRAAGTRAQRLYHALYVDPFL